MKNAIESFLIRLPQAEGKKSLNFITEYLKIFNQRSKNKAE
jgi:hypothetical protein